MTVSKLQFLLKITLIYFVFTTASANECPDIIELKPIPKRLIDSLNTISDAYCKQGGKGNIIVTSGTRTPKSQANGMIGCLSRNDCPKYQNKEAFQEIKKAYADAEKTKKKEAVINVIIDQVERGCYISKHLTQHALDLDRHNDANGAKEKECIDSLQGSDLILSNVLEESKKIVYDVIYFEGKKCNHFHVNFTGWDKIPGLHTCPSKKE